MNRFIIFLFALIVSAQSISSQQDPKAEKILNKVSSKVKSYNNIGFDFTYTIYSMVDKSTFSQNGYAVLKGKKYLIKMDHSQIYFDGKAIYNYIPDANEVTISDPEKDYDDFFLGNPSKIFTMYQEDYKYLYKGEDKFNDKICHRVDLYPYSLDRSYSAVKLWIYKDNIHLGKVQVNGKSGDRYFVELRNYDINKSLKEGFFSFDPKDHKDIQVIDTRGL
jgi:outer membrane lipoprotein-sorting protein